MLFSDCPYLHYYCFLGLGLWLISNAFVIQVPRISAAFGVQPPLFLIKEFDNSVIFPSDGSGKFNPSAFISGATYEVQGNTGAQGHNNTSSTSLSPYGVYQVPRCPQSSFPPMPHPPAPHAARRRVVNKAILLAKLAARDPDKPCTSKSARFSYTVITSIVVKLDHVMGECNVDTVAELVRAQVGFEVILLDCKLYPLIAHDSTSGLDFWKSTRKIIATSRSTYEKLVGKSPRQEISTVDGDVEIIEPAAKKPRIADETVADILQKVCNVERDVKSINEKLQFISDIKKGFECVVCRLPCREPVVSSCCQRIIGCGECVSRWANSNSRCPLCRIETSTTTSFHLKGIDCITGLFRLVDDRDNVGEATVEVDTATSEDSSNEFEDLPSFRRATNNS